MRPEPIAVGLAITVAAAAAANFLHDANYLHAVSTVLIVGLIVGSVITALGKAKAN